MQNTNLNFNNIEISPIGNALEGISFAGTYDGRGHYIENINIKTNGDAALFNCISGTICNLGIESGNIEGACAAGFVSHTIGTEALLYNCYNKAIVHGVHRAGGLADSFSGNLINCVNLGECTTDSGEYVGAVSYYLKNGLYIYNFGECVFGKNTNIEYSLLCENINQYNEEFYKELNMNVKNTIQYGLTDKENAVFWKIKNGNLTLDIKDQDNAYNEREYLDEYGEYIPQNDGSEKNPIRIVSEEDIQLLSFFTNLGNSFENQFFRQEEDIDMSSVTNWQTIGKVDDDKIFSGEYNGNGKIISNLEIKNINYAGLFGRISGEIYNIALQNIKIESMDAGGIACIGTGRAFIYNCTVEGTINAKNIAGGISNEFPNGNIYNCWTSLDGKNVYGICGTSARTIKSCYSNMALVDDKKIIENFVQFVSEDSKGNIISEELISKEFAQFLNEQIIKNKYLPSEKCCLWKYDNENKNIVTNKEGISTLLKLQIWLNCYKKIVIIVTIILLVLIFFILKFRKFRKTTHNKRNKTIDVLRMLFAINIMLLHWGQFMGKEELFVPCGYIGVIFFYMVSGFYLAEYVTNKSLIQETSKDLYIETQEYIWKVIKKILPYYLGACLLSFLAVSIVKFDNYKNLLSNFHMFIPEIFMLQMAGFPTYALLGTEWYLSAFIIALVVLFPLLRKFTGIMTHVIAPFLSIMIFGWIAHECGNLMNAGFWTEICYEGVLRAIASILAGVTCYEIVNSLRKKQYKKLSKVCMTIIEWLIWIIVVNGMIKGEKYSSYDFVLALWIFIGLCITLSGITYTNKFISQLVSDFCAKLSIPLFLCHGYLLLILPQYVENIEKWRALTIFLGLVSVTVIIDCIFAKGLMRIKDIVKK